MSEDNQDVFCGNPIIFIIAFIWGIYLKYEGGKE